MFVGEDFNNSFPSADWIFFNMAVIPKVEIWEYSLSVVKLIWLKKEISLVSLETGSCNTLAPPGIRKWNKMVAHFNKHPC